MSAPGSWAGGGEQPPPYAGPPPTVPPPGGQPLYPPPYGQPLYPPPYGPPGYGPPPYGWAGNGAPWPWGAPTVPRRPGQLTAAAVLSFVQAALVVVSALYLLVLAAAVSTVQDDPAIEPLFDVSGLATEALVLAAIEVAAAVLLIVAGVRLLIRRSTATWWLTVGAAGVQVALAVYWAVRLTDLSAGGTGAWISFALVFAAMPVVLLGLTAVGPGRRWLRPVAPAAG